MVFQTPYFDLFQQCNFTKVPVDFTPDTAALVEQQLARGHRPTFFTDGSCFASNKSEMAMAAWALVLSNEPQIEEVNRSLSLGNQQQYLSSLFSTVAIARCHGEQSIDRAELLAAIHLFDRWDRTRLVTDSAYVRKSVELVRNIANENELAMRPNADLLTRLYHTLPGSDHQIIKVESHTLEGRIPKQHNEPFYVLGNYVADQAAKKADWHRI